MSTMYDPATIKRLAETGDKFYQGAYWILRQQEAARITGARASFMSDKISMDEAREKARLDRDRQDPTDEQLDAYIASVRAAGIPVHEVPRTMAREDYDQERARVPNAADLGSPRIP